jgi:lipoprotein-releasing system permease protein
MRIVVFLALRQLWARKLLNGIALGGMTLGVMTLIAMSGIMHGFQKKFLDNMLRISPHVTLFDRELRPLPPLLARAESALVAARVAHEIPTDREQRIKRPQDLVAAAESMGDVTAAAASIAGSAIVAFGPKELPVDLRGIDPLRQDRVTPLSRYVLAGSYRTFASAADEVLLGSGVASRIGAKTGDVVTCGTSRGERRTFKVAGIFESGVPPVDNVRVYMPLRTAQSVLERPDTVSRIEITLVDSERAPAVAARLEALSGYDAESWQETNANFLSLFGIQDAITRFVVTAILVVGGFGILAIQIMIVMQKTRDIAILRSVGFRRADVLGIFLLQGAILASIGGMLGDFAGHNMLELIASLHVHIEGLVKADTFPVLDDPKMYGVGIGFALLVGIVASMLPALHASRVEPVDVLRGQIG